MAKMKAETIGTNDFRICFEADTLLQTEEGATTAFIYWQFGPFCFPGRKWSDFVAVLPAWWIEALRRSNSPQTLHFMDGPYFITATRVGNGDVQIDCHEDRAGKGVVGSYILPLARVQEEVVAVGRAVVAAFREKNWNSRDLKLLSDLLKNPWPGLTS